MARTRTLSTNQHGAPRFAVTTRSEQCLYLTTVPMRGVSVSPSTTAGRPNRVSDRLRHMAEEALREHRAGETEDFPLG